LSNLAGFPQLFAEHGRFFASCSNPALTSFFNRVVNNTGYGADMSAKLTIEKWLGRATLACGVGAILVLSSFAVKVISDPLVLKQPMTVLAYLGAFFLITMPLGLLGSASVILRMINRGGPSLPGGHRFP
jgi:hypothetical protein